MINRSEILQTIAMIDQQHLDIRTITMGISLLDCADTDIERSCTKVYKDLPPCGRDPFAHGRRYRGRVQHPHRQ